MASILTRIERYFEFKTPVVWKNVFIFAFGYGMFFYGCYLFPTVKFTSYILAYLMLLIGGNGVSAGAHKLWTHKTYKAKLPMRIIIMLCYCMAGMYSIVTWSRDHRAHHKFTDTDADPHSSGRGLFFSHCGWLMMKRHPEFKEKAKSIDVSDLWQDPVIRFHQKYFVLLTVLIHMILPSVVIYYVGGESFKNSIIIGFFWRYLLTLNLMWCLNSFAHYWGDKPYNNRDHRAHHKFTDTDADPHSSGRGLFFSHCGWLMMKRHPEFKEKAKSIDVSDLWQDPVIRFHQKYFVLLTVLIHMILPSVVIYYVGGESFKNSIIIGFFWRYLLTLNLMWCLNSFAHYWGDKPYNKNIKATQNAVLAMATVGEGWHNFHHTFPWDYRIGERSQGHQYSAYVIEFFAKIGLAYDLKTASPELIQKIVNKQNLPKNYEAPEPEYSQRKSIASEDIKAS